MWRWSGRALRWPILLGLSDRCGAASACASVPFTQHALQKNLPLRPIWQANLLCIGLSPSKARTIGMSSTGSFSTQYQAQIPASWHALKKNYVINMNNQYEWHAYSSCSTIPSNRERAMRAMPCCSADISRSVSSLASNRPQPSIGNGSGSEACAAWFTLLLAPAQEGSATPASDVSKLRVPLSIIPRNGGKAGVLDRSASRTWDPSSSRLAASSTRVLWKALFSWRVVLLYGCFRPSSHKIQVRPSLRVVQSEKPMCY